MTPRTNNRLATVHYANIFGARVSNGSMRALARVSSGEESVCGNNF
jgi:hypothetical protein